MQAQSDSVQLDEIKIVSYLGERPVLQLPASVALIDSAAIARQPGQSLVPVLNTVSGVRMEERSPGSYRLSVRGSLIRSPFGVRNVKVYFDDFPLTAAGGEAYLNVIDPNSVKAVEVLKGPDGSLFGANSGGVVRFKTYDPSRDSSNVHIGIGSGSYGLFQENVGIEQRTGTKNIMSVNEGWLRSDGYRQHSALDRRYIQLADRWSYSKNAQLRFLFFYSDLNYQTPGGLTLAQFDQNPRQARSATDALPGAVGQNASVRNRTFYGGVLEEVKLTRRINYVVSVFGSATTFENPFITNYEVRNESNIGGRTWLELSNSGDADVRLKWNLGGESQFEHSKINNYGNAHGSKDTVQAMDDLGVTQAFAFTRVSASFYNKFVAEASLSYNFNRLVFSRTAPVVVDEREKVFDPQLMPRLALSYLFDQIFSLRAIVSRGYSPPTLQEIRPSDNTINTALQPESGWNYELGTRLRTRNGRLWWDVSAFYYRLDHAIVPQQNALSQTYYINAGGTDQPGLESQLSITLVKPRSQGFVRGLKLSNAYTFYYFTFRHYENEAGNYSGNQLTGVPQHVSVTGLTISLPKRIWLFAQYNFTGRIPVNDANSQYAGSYHLVQLKAGWTFVQLEKLSMQLSGGVDNLLNQAYSPGNDINAVGARYYNAAPARNYFAKLDVSF